MKRIALGLVALTLATTGSGCCCLGGLFGHGYGGGGYAPSYGAPAYGAPAPACGSCGYGPQAPYGVGPTGYAAPAGTTAYVPYVAPVYASANPAPTL